MKISVAKEIKNNENRVGLIPGGVSALVTAGHEVYFEKGCGEGSGFSDEEYKAVGGKMVATAAEAYAAGDIVVKVKEPIEQEYPLLKEGSTLYTYLHLAADKPLTVKLMEKGVTGVAYETVRDAQGRFPLLTPMSEVAGRLATQIGANFLLKYNGGGGVMLGGIPGVLPGHVVIIGGGVVGTNAAKMALGLGARVTILDMNVARLRELDDIFGARIQTLYYNPYNIAEQVKTADLLISGVYVAGAKATKVVTTEMVKTMRKGSVIVDVAIDQGGSIETIDRITSHSNPVYEAYGVLHYSVANMPGSVPQTSTKGLTNVTLPFLLDMANKGVIAAVKSNTFLKEGVNTYKGHCVYEAVAKAHELKYTDLAELI
ncbi:MAG: alanine dehydrogenase [Defluviitaleaceae bacterium]|nr:alanine dehydrogenase [Defluviitaleaceae bacterium]